MKKKLVASLAAAMVLGVAGTSFAASNPFTDVPAKHWAYGSVTKLAQAGIVDGYGDGTYLGDKMMSRYEMAQITAKAMAHSDKADASQKAMIDQLSVEFASELEGMNVRVSKLEKNASTIKFTGVARLRYEDKVTTASGADSSANSLALRTRIMAAGEINSDWTYNVRFQNVQNLRSAGGDNTTELNIANVRGHIAGIDTTVGRFEYMPNYGLLLDTSMDGVKFAFGNLVKTNVYVGRNTTEGALPTGSKYDVAGVDFKYATSKATNVVAGYYSANDSANVGQNAKAYEVGFDSKIGTDLVLTGNYAKVDIDNVSGNDKAYLVGLNYKVADKKKVGSYSYFVNYRNIQANAQLVPTFDSAVVANGQGGKGYEIGFQYVPTVNAVARVKYVDLKSSPTVTNVEKTKFVQAQVEFFF